MRLLSSCMICRERRKRCVRRRQGVSCNFCIRRGLDCKAPVPEPRPSTERRYGPLSSHMSSERSSSISPALYPHPGFVSEVVDLFFQHYHYSFPSLFHAPTFKAAVADGSVPKILFFGVASLSARFSSHSSVVNIPRWERGKPYADETERLLDLRNVSVPTIQACVLLGIAAATQGEPAQESVFYGIAFRMAIIMDLPNAPVASLLDREINIRVWWSLLTLDTWNSTALCIPRTINWRDDISLPMDEYIFRHDYKHLLVSSPALSQSPRSVIATYEQNSPFSALGHKVKLNLIFYDIIRFTMAVVAKPWTREDLNAKLRGLIAALDDWVRLLPGEWQYSTENLQRWARSDIGRVFVSVHLDFNNACQLLFFQFLYLSQDPNFCNDQTVDYDTACEFAHRCDEHANNICQLMHTAKTYPNTEMSHPLLGHIVIIASAVQIHRLLYSPHEGEIAAARARLEANFATLTRLYEYWPGVAASFSRLKAFHRACLRSRDNPFRLDRWMLQFIVEFSRAVNEKDDEAEDDEHEGLWSLSRLQNMLVP